MEESHQSPLRGRGHTTGETGKCMHEVGCNYALVRMRKRGIR